MYKLDYDIKRCVIYNISEMKKILDLVVLLGYLRNKYGAGAEAITLADIQSAKK
jgi:hypothetical protein